MILRRRRGMVLLGVCAVVWFLRGGYSGLVVGGGGVDVDGFMAGEE